MKLNISHLLSINLLYLLNCCLASLSRINQTIGGTSDTFDRQSICNRQSVECLKRTPSEDMNGRDWIYFLTAQKYTDNKEVAIGRASEQLLKIFPVFDLLESVCTSPKFYEIIRSHAKFVFENNHGLSDIFTKVTKDAMMNSLTYCHREMEVLGKIFIFHENVLGMSGKTNEYIMHLQRFFNFLVFTYREYLAKNSNQLTENIAGRLPSNISLYRVMPLLLLRLFEPSWSDERNFKYIFEPRHSQDYIFLISQDIQQTETRKFKFLYIERRLGLTVDEIAVANQVFLRLSESKVKMAKRVLFKLSYEIDPGCDNYAGMNKRITDFENRNRRELKIQGDDDLLD